MYSFYTMEVKRKTPPPRSFEQRQRLALCAPQQPGSAPRGSDPTEQGGVQRAEECLPGRSAFLGYLFVSCAMFCLFNGPTFGIRTSDCFHLSYLDSALGSATFGIFLWLLDTTGPDSRALTAIPVFPFLFVFHRDSGQLLVPCQPAQVGIKSLWKSDGNAYSQNQWNVVYY